MIYFSKHTTKWNSRLYILCLCGLLPHGYFMYLFFNFDLPITDSGCILLSGWRLHNHARFIVFPFFLLFLRITNITNLLN